MVVVYYENMNYSQYEIPESYEHFKNISDNIVEALKGAYEKGLYKDPHKYFKLISFA